MRSFSRGASLSFYVRTGIISNLLSMLHRISLVGDNYLLSLSVIAYLLSLRPLGHTFY